MEGRTVKQLLRDFLGLADIREHEVLLDKLQWIHDGEDVKDWVKELKDLAWREGLNSVVVSFFEEKPVGE